MEPTWCSLQTKRLLHSSELANGYSLLTCLED